MPDALRSLCLAAWLWAAATGPATAQIVTDRPDAAESSLVVGEGVYQLEQGLSAAWRPGSPRGAFPSLHRVGVSRDLELRLETPVAELTGAGAAFQELALGAKWHLRDGGELGQPPSLALLGHTAFDRQGTIEPLLRLLLDTRLPQALDMSLNLGAAWPLDSPLPRGQFALAINRDQGDRLGTYGEVWGAQEDDGLGLFLGGGLTYLLNDDLQLDGALYRGLTPVAPPWSATVGVSFRAR